MGNFRYPLHVEPPIGNNLERRLSEWSDVPMVRTFSGEPFSGSGREATRPDAGLGRTDRRQAAQGEPWAAGIEVAQPGHPAEDDRAGMYRLTTRNSPVLAGVRHEPQHGRGSLPAHDWPLRADE